MPSDFKKCLNTKSLNLLFIYTAVITDIESGHACTVELSLFEWMRLCCCMHPCSVCVGGGQEGALARGTDVCCIVAVCVDGRGPGAAFVSPAFKSTHSLSAASCHPSPPPSSSHWREGKDVCVCVCACVCAGAALAWRRRLQQSLLCPPPPSQVTVGGPSWLALGRLDPYGTGGGEESLVNVQINCCCLCFLLIFLISYHIKALFCAELLLYFKFYTWMP